MLTLETCRGCGKAFSRANDEASNGLCSLCERRRDTIKLSLCASCEEKDKRIAELRAGLIEYFKLAELFGSRARARWRGDPEPENADWDFCVFTDDPTLRQSLRSVLETVGSVRENASEFWVETESGDHLNVMPLAKREELLAAYRHQDETGCSKNEMVDILQQVRLQRERAEKAERERDAAQAHVRELDAEVSGWRSTAASIEERSSKHTAAVAEEWRKQLDVSREDAREAWRARDEAIRKRDEVQKRVAYLEDELSSCELCDDSLLVSEAESAALHVIDPDTAPAVGAVKTVICGKCWEQLARCIEELKRERDEVRRLREGDA